MSDLKWGDTVYLKSGRLTGNRVGSIAEIVGIREIENVKQSEQFSAPLGSRVYLVEFGDGSSLEVPEGVVEAAPAAGQGESP